ncbi:MAG: hypothetical protein V7672_00825 [Brevundimonas sp.]|uniref:hypothetical protein n=1 Tax=Brevundimonas sp. TaxID=1871086 RepID=UPI003002FD09
MNRRETAVIGKIDRGKERAEVTEQRNARWKALEARASSLVTAEIGELPEDDRPAFATALASAIRAQLVMLHGPVPACSILSREASQAGRDILPRKIAAAEAERLFAKASNDGGRTP